MKNEDVIKFHTVLDPVVLSLEPEKFAFALKELTN